MRPDRRAGPPAASSATLGGVEAALGTDDDEPLAARPARPGPAAGLAARVGHDQARVPGERLERARRAATSGSRARRDCIAASRATRPRRASACSPRSPSQRTTDRRSVIGITASTPSSTSWCTTGAGLVALRRRERDDDAGRSAGSTRHRAGRREPQPTVADLRDRAEPPRAAPVARGDGLADAQPADPLQVMAVVAVDRTSVVVVADASSTKTCATAGAAAAKPSVTARRTSSGSARRTHLPAVRATSSPRSSANWRSSSCSSSESSLRDVDVDLHEQVAATAALQHRHALALEPEHVAGLRARAAR